MASETFIFLYTCAYISFGTFKNLIYYNFLQFVQFFLDLNLCLGESAMWVHMELSHFFLKIHNISHNGKLCIYVYVCIYIEIHFCMHVCTHTVPWAWRSEENLWELVLAFCCVGPRDRTQARRLDIKHLYPPSHLPGTHWSLGWSWIPNPPVSFFWIYRCLPPCPALEWIFLSKMISLLRGIWVCFFFINVLYWVFPHSTCQCLAVLSIVSEVIHSFWLGFFHWHPSFFKTRHLLSHTWWHMSVIPKLGRRCLKNSQWTSSTFLPVPGLVYTHCAWHVVDIR